VNDTGGTRARKGIIAGASGLLVLAAVGCSASGSGASGSGASGNSASGHATGSGSAGAAASASVRAATSSPGAAVLDGNSLYGLLLSASAMPHGYHIDSSGTRNSGQSLPQDSPQPVSASQACNLLTGTSWITAAGINSSDFAQNDYLNPSKTAEVAQEIDYFQPGNATKVMSRLWQVFGRCRSFTQQAEGTTAKTALTRARLRRVGDGGIKAVEISPVIYGGTTLAAIRVGDAVVTCLDSSPGSDDGAAAVTMCTRIAQRIRAAQQAG
jgi:hypothetical protein